MKSHAEIMDVSVFKAGARVLFQGDSITDGARGRNTDPNHILGHGYCFIVAAKYGARYPERHLEFINRGVSGNKVTDLQARWQQDTLDLKPDVLSILIGINDRNNVPLDQYEKVYDRLLTETQAVRPGVKLVLGEPFFLAENGPQPQDADVAARQQIVAALAKQHGAAFVRFQKVFDDACRRAPARYWIWDGIHPTFSGHQLMADEWVRAVNEHFTRAGR